jgi:hypothetical protein
VQVEGPLGGVHLGQHLSVRDELLRGPHSTRHPPRQDQPR